MKATIVAAVLTLVLGTGSVAMAESSPSPSPAPSPAASSAASAALEIARSRVDTMLRSGHADATWFAAGFLAQIPVAKVDEIVASIEATLGDYRSLDVTPAKFVAHFARGTDDVLVHLDADDRIDGLLFRPPVTTSASLEESLRTLAGTAPVVSYLITDAGRVDRAAHDATQPLAIGSAFKLAVLCALSDQIAGGRRAWHDVVALDGAWKSLPSGVLQTWPDGTPLTLATLATQMISISDNTAADALVRITGPQALAPYAGGNEPFLTTRQMFTLKSTPAADLLAAYRSARTPGERSAILERVDRQPLPAVADLLKAPELAVEWHYSVRDLCGFIAHVGQNALLSVNPGIADPAAFGRVAFKGGSDTGVINLTTLVTTKSGRTMCFSATGNDAAAAIDEHAFVSAYGGVLRFLEQG